MGRRLVEEGGAVPVTHIEVGPRVEWLRLHPSGAFVDLARRGPMRRLMTALLRAYRAGGRALSVEEMVDAGWPGDRSRPESAAARVYATVRLLRRAGLHETLETVDGGYRLAPGIEVRESGRSEEPPVVERPPSKGGERRWEGRFVGRAAESRAVKAWLDPRGPRWMVITGPPGAGKSRLMAEALRASDGRTCESLVVDVAAARREDDVLDGVRRALGMHGGGASEERVRSALALRGPLLLCLDGVRLGDDRAYASFVSMCEEWLRAAPQFRLLWTSSRHDRLPATVALLRLQPLPPDEGLALLACRAWGERAARDVSACAALVEALDGLPLALELAAVRLRSLPVEALLERLRAHGAGQGTSLVSPLDASLRVTWESLCGAGRASWAACAVFEGAFSLEDVAHVLPEGRVDAAEAVQGLVERSLLQPEPHGEGGALRYRMLRAVRDFVSGHPEAATLLVEARRAHAARVASLGVPRESFLLLHGTERPGRLDRLRAAEDDLRAAIQWAEAEGEGVLEAGAWLALSELWLEEGVVDVRAEEMARVASLERLPCEHRAWIARHASRMYFLSGAFDRAAKLLSVAERLAGDDVELRAWIALDRVSLGSYGVGRDDGAPLFASEAFEEEVSEAARAKRDAMDVLRMARMGRFHDILSQCLRFHAQWSRSPGVRNLEGRLGIEVAYGFALASLGYLDEGIEVTERAARLAEEARFDRLAMRLWVDRLSYLVDARRLREAEEAADLAETWADRHGERWLRAALDVERARAALWAGRREESWQWLLSSQELAATREPGHPAHAYWYGLGAHVACEAGRHGRAHALLLEAESSAEACQDPYFRLLSFAHAGLAAVGLGELSRAERLLESCEALVQGLRLTEGSEGKRLTASLGEQIEAELSGGRRLRSASR